MKRARKEFSKLIRRKKKKGEALIPPVPEILIIVSFHHILYLVR